MHYDIIGDPEDPLYIHPSEIDELSLGKIFKAESPLEVGVRLGCPFDYIYENYEDDPETREIMLDRLQEWRDSGLPITTFLYAKRVYQQ